MASQRSSSEATTYRDRSPISPASPVAPIYAATLPQWLRAGRARSGIFGHSRIRLALVALGCILLGWMVTSTLGPNEEVLDLNGGVSVYDAASGGVLGDPSGFGQPKEELVEDEDEDVVDEKNPSVSGALSDLHHAVSDKIQAWNPYYKPDKTTGNKTAGSKTSHKKPANSTAPASLGEFISEGIPEEERLGARTRVGKCTILFNGNSYWERAIRTHEQHDRLHGYRLHVLRQHLLDDVWSKPAYILSLLLRELGKPESERLDWLFWVDADTIILNPHVPIEVFLPPPGKEFEHVHLIYSADWNGLNNGVFPVRVNRWAVELFSAIVAFRYYKPDTELIFRDQSAMNMIMNDKKFVHNIVQAPQRWFNAYQGEHNETLAPFQIRRGDLLVHFAGVPNREERMGYWLDRAEQHLDDWEVPLKSTSYPQERKDFWAEYGDLRKNRKASMAETRLKATQTLAKTAEKLQEYGDRLTEDERTAILKQKETLDHVMSDDKYAEDVDKVKEETAALQRISLPLLNAVNTSNKLLLDAAHEAIFAGERDLHEAGFAKEGGGVPDPDLSAINAAVRYLKDLVMAPQEQWQKAQITAATDSLTQARGKWQESSALKVAETNRLADLEAAKAELQAQVNKEAAEAAGLAVVAQPATTVVHHVEGPPTTLIQIATVVGEPVIQTVMGEPVIETVMGENVAVTLYETVENAAMVTVAPEAVAVA